MDVSFLLLSMADTIYMLNGWENSKGANREYGYALGRGYAVVTEELEKDSLEIEGSYDKNWHRSYRRLKKVLSKM